ncbi:hypothetical protein NDU88_004580 [Pleurodeles waltl]|uniref:Uncharacterized protein n=1 Tax=Pleurodeles waltl TaxID=8319 RepID=A0AAV7NN30_PLEWA|nr:hypothetical protein NDU88_004580 [Pleurodeles waltl]
MSMISTKIELTEKRLSLCPDLSSQARFSPSDAVMVLSAPNTATCGEEGGQDHLTRTSIASPVPEAHYVDEHHTQELAKKPKRMARNKYTEHGTQEDSYLPSLGCTAT